MKIEPLFLFKAEAYALGKNLLYFQTDNYNKAKENCLIEADNDAKAIEQFLQEFNDSELTLQSYAKELERLLLWCIHVEQVNIASLKHHHLLAYREFIQAPEPAKLWCGPKAARTKKDGSVNPNWRPFVAGLADSSVKKVITILDSFFNYLVQTNYLIGNPLAVYKRRKKNLNKKSELDRYLEIDEINLVLATLTTGKDNVAKADESFNFVRAYYIVVLLFYTGLRISESANHTMGNFVVREKNWFLQIIGKGQKLRNIPVPDELLDALARFRLAVGLETAEPAFAEATPLIPMRNLTLPIKERRIDQILKWAFNLTAINIEKEQPRIATKLRKASAHWLRHSYVTHLLNSGATLKTAQENAGHSGANTTMLYTHVADQDRHQATKSLSLHDKD